jgi:LemA protein
MTVWYILAGIVVLAILWLIGTYNGLVQLRNRTDEAWSDIDVQAKRRYDLIPNLIETVKGYAAHETKAFDAVSQARSAAMGAQSPEAKGQAENMLTAALKTVIAVAEAYPDLKASANFSKLQDELSDTENKMEASRRFYNGNVRDLNTKIQQFPTNMIAGSLGMKSREFFEIENDAERKPVAVKF